VAVVRIAWVVVITAALTAGCGRVGFDPGGPGGSAAGDALSGGTQPLGVVHSLASVASVEIGTDVNRLLATSSLVFAATTRVGAELAIFDITDPAQPVEIGSATTAGIPYGLFLDGSRLYVTTETGGDDLEIFDVSNPRAPVKLGGIAAADTAYRVVVAAGRAYVTSESGGDDFEIFDVSNPAAPAKLGGLDLLPSYYARGVAVNGALAYTAGQRMNVIDVSNPATPVILGDGGFYWYAYDLQVIGDRAYGLESNNSGGPQLRIWDVAIPSAPVQLGTANIWDSYGRALEIVGPYAFTVCAPGMYPTGSELEVWDTSGSGDPVRVTSAHLDHDGYAVALAGRYIYVGVNQSSDPELLVFEAHP
jgi:hypothetical protein